MFSNFFAPLAIKIFSGVTLALAVALGIVMWRADAISADRDDWRKEAQQAEVKLAASNASIDLLERELQEIAIAAEVRAMELERRRKQAEADKTRLAAQAERSQRRIDELNRIAREAGPSCPVPQELLDQLEGL